MSEQNETMIEQLPEEDLKSKAQIYDEKIAAFKDEIAKEEDIKVLEDLEQKTIAEIEEHDTKLSAKTYSLPKDCTFRGTTFTRAKVGEYVVDLLNRQEVGWQMTLGLYDTMDFWKNIKDVSELPYAYYDATLRLLGQQKYSGYETLRKVLTVNALFGESRQEYVDDLAETYYLADKHNAIIDRMNAIHALTEPIGK